MNRASAAYGGMASVSDSAAAGPNRRRRLGAGAVILGVSGTLVVGLCWLWSAQPSIPQKGQIPLTDVNPYGANFFLDREVEHWKQEKTLEMARAAGIVWIKQQFSWEEIEPQRKGEFEWSKYDRIVELAEQYGMQIIARLDRPPDWTREDNRFKTRPPDDLADLGDFVYAFVQRYAGRIRYIQVWNEPNLTSEWGFERVDAVAYTHLLQVAYGRAKEADPNIVVLSGPLAITLEDASMRGNHNDLVFLDQMYQAGAREYFDVLSANAFGLDRPPEEPPDPSVLNFRRLELQRAIMERYGDADKPIWINEYGWNAAPTSIPKQELLWERVTEAEQADYIVRGIAYARQHWPWLGVVNIWYFRQVGDVPPERAAYYFALVDPQFNPLPAYQALQESAQDVSSAEVGLHQETSPAVSAPGWRLILDPAASAGAYLASTQGAGHLVFSFRGSQLAIVVGKGSEVSAWFADIDGSFADLRVRDERDHHVVYLARDLDEGQHRFTLTPGGAGPILIDAFLVSRGTQIWPFGALWGLCAAAIATGGFLWRQGRTANHSTPT